MDDSLGDIFPPEGTGSLCEFAVSFIKIQSFLVYILEYVRDHAMLNRLIDIYGESLASSPADDPYKMLGYHKQFLLEVILSRHVDNYLCFLSSILKECLLSRPEAMLALETSISLEMVLSHESKESLLQTVAEDEVQRLSYKSFGDLARFFGKNLKIKIANELQKSKIIQAIEIRNISIHNRCVIDKKYCRKTGTDQAQAGSVMILDYDHLKEIAKALAASAIHSDSELSEKYRLQKVSIKKGRQNLWDR